MSNRALTAGAASAVVAQTVNPVAFYEGVYTTGTLRLWTGVGDFTWDSKTWTGAGHMLGISPITETSDVRAVGFTVSLSGDASDILAINLGAARPGLAGRVWIGFFDAAGALIADPYKAFEARLDVPDILDEGERCTVSVKYESRLVDLDRTRERRYTDEDQQIDYPGDRGFEYVAALQDMQITWGRPGGAPVAPPPTPAAPTGTDISGGEVYGGAGGGGGAGGDPVGAIEQAPGGSISMGIPETDYGAAEHFGGSPGVAAIEAAPAGSISMGVADSAAATDFGASTPGSTIGDASAYGGDFAGVGGGVGEAGGGGEGGGKVICTALFHQGLIDRGWFEADQAYGRELHAQRPATYKGYRIWADLAVRRLKGEVRTPYLTRVLFWKSRAEQEELSYRIAHWLADRPTQLFVREIAYRRGAAPSSSVWGYLLVQAWEAVCAVIGGAHASAKAIRRAWRGALRRMG